jgi:hypothetical protein
LIFHFFPVSSGKGRSGGGEIIINDHKNRKMKNYKQIERGKEFYISGVTVVVKRETGRKKRRDKGKRK